LEGSKWNNPNLSQQIPDGQDDRTRNHSCDIFPDDGTQGVPKLGPPRKTLEQAQSLAV